MSELPVSPRTKTDYRECLRVCHEWADELDDPEPFDEWAEQLARRMDMEAAAAYWGGRR